MVTMNVETDLDIANGSRGTVQGIILHPDEPEVGNGRRVRLKYLPEYILVKLDNARMAALSGLAEGVVPVVPSSKGFTITIEGKKTRTVHRAQYPMTPAYAFTDIRSQGQTIPRVIVDITIPLGVK